MSVIEWLEAGKGRSCMSEIQDVGTGLRSLWDLWNQLEGVLFQCWDDTIEATSQQLLVVPQSLVPLVIQSLHNGAGGWPDQTLAKIKDQFFWPGMRSDVEDWCQQCPN